MSSRQYFDIEHPIRFAHRGSRILWPENTWHAFDHAIGDFGYRYIETDVQVTADGVVIVFHDDTLERCTNGVGKVADWHWEDLQHLDAAYSFSPDGESFPLRGTGIGISRLDDTFDREDLFREIGDPLCLDGDPLHLKPDNFACEFTPLHVRAPPSPH
jgi:glycerophosphoryl diester phosphodiesterase